MPTKLTLLTLCMRIITVCSVLNSSPSVRFPLPGIDHTELTDGAFSRTEGASRKTGTGLE